MKKEGNYNRIYNALFGTKEQQNRIGNDEEAFRHLQVLIAMQEEDRFNKANLTPYMTAIEEADKDDLIEVETPSHDPYNNMQQVNNIPISQEQENEPSFIEMFNQWATGQGPDHIVFNEGSKHVENMKDAWRVKQAREHYYKNKSPNAFREKDKHYTNVKGAFGLEGLANAGLDPTEQFVGSYKIDINSRKDEQNNPWLNFELNNNTSLKSFLYGIGPDWERETLRPLGNMRQTYKWSEPYDPSWAAYKYYKE